MKQPFFIRRFFFMSAGVFLLGVGIGLFKASLLGNDPNTAMVIASAGQIGLDFSIMNLLFNSLYFLLEFCFGRTLIGVGTFVNWGLVGIVASLSDRLVRNFFGSPEALVFRLFLMLTAVLILSFSCSLYQTAALGISPYDSLSIMLAEKTGKPYVWCRALTDSLCTVIAFLLGGLIGVGTLVCAVGLGPFIAFLQNTRQRN